MTSVEVGASAVPAQPMSPSLVPLPPGVAKGGCADASPEIMKSPSSTAPHRSRGAGPNDAGQPDSGPRGAGPNDAGRPDSDPHGAGPNDAGRPNSDPHGAGPNDAGRPNALAAPDPDNRAAAVSSLAIGTDRLAAVPVPRATDDAEERRRKALESQQTPVPRRGDVPAAAIPGAEACVRLLQIEFTLQAAATGAAPADAAIQATLLKVGLRKPVVKPGPAFAASTGSACITGTFVGAEPSMTIAPLNPAGACAA